MLSPAMDPGAFRGLSSEVKRVHLDIAHRRPSGSVYRRRNEKVVEVARLRPRNPAADFRSLDRPFRIRYICLLSGLSEITPGAVTPGIAAWVLGVSDSETGIYEREAADCRTAECRSLVRE